MTPERLAELRLMAEHQRGMEALGEALAAYDAIADGSAVRSARASERDAVRRAGDAEERAEWLGRMLDATAAERDEARAAIATLTERLEVTQRAVSHQAHEVAPYYRERAEKAEAALAIWEAWDAEHDGGVHFYVQRMERLWHERGLSEQALAVERDEARVALADSLRRETAALCEHDAMKEKHAAERSEWIAQGMFSLSEVQDERDAMEHERDEARVALDEARVALDEARTTVDRERTARHAAEIDAEDACNDRDVWVERARFALGEMTAARQSEGPLPYEYGSGPPTRSAKGVPASEIAANQVPSQPGVIAKLAAQSLEERVATLEADVRGLRGAP